MNREEIKNYILSKDNDTLEYYCNYFYILVNNPQIIGTNDIYSLIDNALVYASKIVFYDEDNDIYKELGPDCKGLREPNSKIIYVRKDLEEPLREIIIYHELHHAVQTNPKNDEVGINQESNIGRMVMEAQTQYFAEKVYEEIHEFKFELRDIPTESLRMISGGTITSSLHNYEMYDTILSKLSIMLDIPKDFFVRINYLYDDNVGLNEFKRVYEEVRYKYNFPLSFDDYLFWLDYIYCVDLMAYKDNPDKEVLLSGKETKNNYEIHPNKGYKLSLVKEFNIIDELDRKYFVALLDADANYVDYAKYIVKNETRDLALKLIGTENSKVI